MSSPSKDPLAIAQSATETWSLKDFAYIEQLSRKLSINFADGTVFDLYLFFKTLVDAEDVVYLSFLIPPIKEVIYRVSILKANGDKCHSQEFHYLGDQQGHPGYYQENYIRRDQLLDEDNEFLVEGTLILHCQVDRLEPSKALADFKDLLYSHKLSDVILVVGGKELHAHKAFLAARSPIFEAMFSSENASEGKIPIDDIQTEVFESLLVGLYTGHLPSLEQYAQELYIAANKYQVVDLKAKCLHYLTGHLFANSVISLILFADRHGVVELKTACIKYITANVTSVLASDGWKQFKMNRTAHVDLLVEVVEGFGMLF